MKKLYVLLLFAIPISVFSQRDIIIPEEISQKCVDIPLKDRIRVTVAEFAYSAKGPKGKNIDNVSSMLSNALFKVNCFRVLSMQKDNSMLEGVSGRSLSPHAVVTGEITEYYHEETAQKFMMKTKITTTAHIGMIVTIRNNYTGDMVFSESVNTSGDSENSSLSMTVKIPNKLLNTALGPQTIGSEMENNIDAAYQDALEKAIIETVALMVNNNARMVKDVRDNIPANYDEMVQTASTASGGASTEMLLDIRNVSFKNLMALETKLKSSSWVASVKKTMNNGVGQLTVQHRGNQEDLLTVITSFGNTFEITGFDDKKISLTETR